MVRINDKATYLDRIVGPDRNDERCDKAIKVALETRQFEIELYWKRAAYFWTFIAAAFVGIIALHRGDKPFPAVSLVLVSCVGLILAIAWYLVNRGSKYWQTNWELHVDMLEDEALGPLFKTVVARDQYRLTNLVGAYPFSVSKVNQILSLFIVVVWLGLTIYSLSRVGWSTGESLPSIALLLVTAFFAVLLLVSGRTSEGEIELELETREIKRDAQKATDRH